MTTISSFLTTGAVALVTLASVAGCGRSAPSSATAGDAAPSRTLSTAPQQPVASTRPSATPSTRRSDGAGERGSGSGAADDGTAGAGPWSPALLPRAEDLVEFGEATTPWRAGSTHDGLPARWLRPCRTKASDPPVPPGFVAAVSRDYTSPGPDGAAGAQAQSVLLDYPTQPAAQAAYRDLAGTYTACSATLRAGGATHVSQTRSTEDDLGAFSSGPNAAEATTYLVTYAAPPADHAVVDLQHGIAIDGSHLLVVTMAREAQEDWPDLAWSMPSIVQRFGRTSGLPDKVILDHQLRYVRLSESYADAMSAGDLTQCGKGSGDAARYCARGWGAGGSVCVSRTQGVEAIALPADVATTAGLRADESPTVGDLRRMYPEASQGAHGTWRVPVPGGDSYAVQVGGLDHDVTGIVLERAGQECYH